jgi:hypothetical protein
LYHLTIELNAQKLNNIRFVNFLMDLIFCRFRMFRGNTKQKMSVFLRIDYF